MKDTAQTPLSEVISFSMTGLQSVDHDHGQQRCSRALVHLCLI